MHGIRGYFKSKALREYRRQIDEPTIAPLSLREWQAFAYGYEAEKSILFQVESLFLSPKYYFSYYAGRAAREVQDQSLVEKMLTALIKP